jgi:hypothetical protein
MWKLLKWTGLVLGLVVLGLIAPIAYVEVACRGTPGDNSYKSLITEAEFQRPEANSFLTYPEWHIVYAYEGLAETLKTGDEHDFGYFSAVKGFWSSYCALNAIAQQHGGADFATRRTIYVIGASFTLEMGLKAIYEETLGRVFALIRGAEKSPQDDVSKTMAADYATFLHQTPWYKYDFADATSKLWQAPVTSIRSWERRLALGGEWKAKAAYAGMIAQAVEATGVAQLEIKSAVTGLTQAQLAEIKDVQVMGAAPQGFIIKTPRYAAFNAILDEIGRRGGTVTDIAGNDDIMVTVTGKSGAKLPETAEIITDVPRDGFDERRWILKVKVPNLLKVLGDLRSGGLRVEHVYDY